MTITVAVPCFNLENQIERCLDSIISQDYQDLDILVIDDHSTDRSVEVVRKLIETHPERVIRHLVNEKNLGLNIVRIIAIKEARGEAIFFVDGDDTIETGALTLFQQGMEETGAEVVCGFMSCTL